MNRRRFISGAGSIGLAVLTGGALAHASDEAGVGTVEALKRGPRGFVQIEHEITNPVDRATHVEARFVVYDAGGEVLNDRYTGFGLDAGESREVDLVVPAMYEEAAYYEVEVRAE